jgi:hypothetical protein
MFKGLEQEQLGNEKNEVGPQSALYAMAGSLSGQT